MTVTLDRIRDAQQALQSVIIATPMIPDDQLSKKLGARAAKIWKRLASATASASLAAAMTTPQALCNFWS